MYGPKRRDGGGGVHVEVGICVLVDVVVGVVVGGGGCRVVVEVGVGGGGVHVEVGVGALVEAVGVSVVVEGRGGGVGIDVHGRLVYVGDDFRSLGTTSVVDIWRWW